MLDLYPRLDPMRRTSLLKSIREDDRGTLGFSSCEHSEAFVAPVGGTPVHQGELIELLGKVRTKLSDLGYPQGIRSVFEEAV